MIPFKRYELAPLDESQRGFFFMNMKYQKGEFITIPNKSTLRGLDPVLQVVFLWLCDHSDDNMQSFPSRASLAAECGISVRTLDRAMQELVSKGFIAKSARYSQNVRSSNLYEVVIFAGGDKSALGGDKNDTRGVQILHGGGDKNSTQNSTHLTQPIELNSTNVLDVPSKVYGKPEINELFDYWQSKTGLAIQSRVKENRNACNSMLKKHGVDKLRLIIGGVAQAQGEKFAPQISNFIDLQSKLDALLVWGRKQQAIRGTIKI